MRRRSNAADSVKLSYAVLGVVLVAALGVGLQLGAVLARAAVTAGTTAPTPTPALATPRATAAIAEDPTQAPSTPLVSTPPATPDTCARTAAVDATGTADVTAALQAFLNASPDGTVACLAAGGRYRVDGGLHLAHRHRLTIDGRGATLFATVQASAPMLLIDGGGGDIRVHDLRLVGANPHAGTPQAFDPAWEGNHGIAIGGAVHVEIGPAVSIESVGGDGVYITSGTAGGVVQWSDGVTVHDCLVTGAGRMGIALTDGARNVTVEHCRFADLALYAFDLEPNGHVFNGAAAGAEHIRFADNQVGVYGLSPELSPLLFAGTGVGPETDVTLTRTTVTGVPLRIGVWDVQGSLRRGFQITDNTSDTPTAGPVMIFTGVDGLTVSGNVQPLVSGPLTQVTRCTNADVQ